MFLHECIFEKIRASSEKLRGHFHLVFPVMPDKAAFERITLITAITGETAICPAPTALPAGRELMYICKSVDTGVCLQT